MIVGMMVSNISTAQEKRASPAMTAEGVIGEANISINYSSPAAKGRTLFGDLVPYGKVWRAGANEATTFETTTDIMVEGEKLAAGKYSVFVIPTEENWTFIFNAVAEQWGAYKYDKANDALRVSVMAVHENDMSERLTYKISDAGLTLMWGNSAASVGIK